MNYTIMVAPTAGNLKKMGVFYQPFKGQSTKADNVPHIFLLAVHNGAYLLVNDNFSNVLQKQGKCAYFIKRRMPLA